MTVISLQEIETRFYLIQESHQNLINDLSKDIIKLKQSNNSLKTAEFLSHELIIQLVSYMLLRKVIFAFLIEYYFPLKYKHF